MDKCSATGGLDALYHSTAHPNIEEFERRFRKIGHPIDPKSPPEIQSYKTVSKGRHMCLFIKNPRTLCDVLNWSQRDLYGFTGA